ncbi:hypothetical protein D3C71_1330360 [compost metagenome]
MGEVPDGQGAALVDQLGHGLHVVHVAGLVVDVGQHHHGDVLVNRLRQRLRAVHQTQAVALLQQVHQPFGNVQIGGEVARLADNHPPLRRSRGLHAQGRAEHLEQVDRGGIGDHHFAFTGTDQPGQAIAQALRQIAPAGAVPAADQTIAPLLGNHRPGALKGRNRAGAQGVAVEVDHALGQGKLITQRGQGVLRIERQAIVSCGHCRSCSLSDMRPVATVFRGFPCLHDEQIMNEPLQNFRAKWQVI